MNKVKNVVLQNKNKIQEIIYKSCYISELSNCFFHA